MRHSIKPLTGGETFTAASFKVLAHLDSEDPLKAVHVRFYDAAGKQIPDGAIRPLHTLTMKDKLAAIAALAAGVANAGETMQATLLRLGAVYVATVFGVTVTS